MRKSQDVDPIEIHPLAPLPDSVSVERNDEIYRVEVRAQMRELVMLVGVGGVESAVEVNTGGVENRQLHNARTRVSSQLM